MGGDVDVAVPSLVGEKCRLSMKAFLPTLSALRGEAGVVFACSSQSLG